jgi:hypothetical protein
MISKPSLADTSGPGSVTPEQVRSLARAHAPIVQLHPEDRFRPMSPVGFVADSRLRMYDRRQPAHLPLHPVLNLRTLEWAKPPTLLGLRGHEYFGPPLGLLGSLALHDDGANRRPFDGKAASRGNVFLEHRHKTPRGEDAPTGNAPTFFYWKSIGGGDGLLTFWFFYGYSRYQAVQLFGHQGDWEHVSLVLGPNGRVRGAYFAAHGRPKRVDADDLERVDGRTVVYSAKESHASYPTPGEHADGDETQAGQRWETWRSLESLSVQEWRRFAGAWGAVGTLAATTGPLGPWYKRHRR